MIDFYACNSANGQKVALMLHEAGFDYRLHHIDLKAGEHRADAFLAINPAGKVPAIVDPDLGTDTGPLPLSQSLAIVLYLARKSGRLLPKDTGEWAEADRYMAMISSDVAGAFSNLFYFKNVPHLMGASYDEKIVSVLEKRALDCLKLIDDRLAQSEFLAGPDYTIADVLAYPVAVTSTRLLSGDPLGGFPDLSRWAGKIGQRDAVKQALDALSPSAG